MIHGYPEKKKEKKIHIKSNPRGDDDMESLCALGKGCVGVGWVVVTGRKRGCCSEGNIRAVQANIKIERISSFSTWNSSEP